jgi:hypothetical protein
MSTMLLYCPAVIKNLATFHVRNVHHLVKLLPALMFFI